MEKDRKEYLIDLFPEIKQIKDIALAEKVLEIWNEVLEESSWERVEDVPKNPLFAGEEDTLLRHTQSVTKQSIEVAKVISQFCSKEINMDLLIAAAILHDVCKLLEYNSLGVSEFGKLIQHGVYSAVKGFKYELPLELNHILITHTKKSSVLPQTIEGIILHYIDYMDSDIGRFYANKPLLLRK